MGQRTRGGLDTGAQGRDSHLWKWFRGEPEGVNSSLLLENLPTNRICGVRLKRASERSDLRSNTGDPRSCKGEKNRIPNINTMGIERRGA